MRHKSYAIAALYKYSSPDWPGMDKVVIMGCGPGEIVCCGTLTEARAAVKKINAEKYLLSPGEEDRPEYIILTEYDATYLATGRHINDDDYDWSKCSCRKSGSDNNPCRNYCEICWVFKADEDKRYALKHRVG
ncbi:MAG: hypothetical protein CVU77_05235 [Elusimicrobia bacterium HGW-Elusimicrobia-1]|jgi:hypothetical protein|nr:MAG: hypothetical protein CVU77_05235 [Elusimicrobia bacterium HGW-Elusimicrobia-1]